VRWVFSEIERDADGTCWQMYADPANRQWNVVGEVFDVVEDENAFNGTVGAPVIVATRVEHVDATAAAHRQPASRPPARSPGRD